MKIVFLSFSYSDDHWAIPLAAGNLKAVLDQQFSGHQPSVESRILDRQIADDTLVVSNEIFELAPDLLAISLYLWNREKTLELLEALRPALPKMIVIAGGPDSEFQDAKISNLVDFLIRGEGESVLPLFVQKLLHAEFPEKELLEEWVANERGLLTTKHSCHLEALPSPYLTGTLSLKNRKAVLWELSRGCPFKCSFCYESRGSDGVRFFPMKRIKAELDAFVSAGIAQIFVLDPTFNAKMARAKELLKLFQAKAPDIHFTLELRVEYIDDELAFLLSQINCSVQIGLQSSNNKVLGAINRKMNHDLFQDKILKLHHSQVIYGFDLIYGLPNDTLKQLNESLDFSLSMVPNHLNIFRLAALPGTQIRDEAETYGIEYMTEAPYLVLENTTFSREEMKQGEKIAQAVNVLYNKGRGVSWVWILLDWTGLKASELIRNFIDWVQIKALDISKPELPSLRAAIMVQAFLMETLTEKTHRTFMSDMVSYFTTISILHDEGVSPKETMFKALDADSITLPFYYDLEILIDALEQGTFDPEDLLGTLELNEPPEQALYFYQFRQVENEVVIKNVLDK